MGAGGCMAQLLHRGMLLGARRAEGVRRRFQVDDHRLERRLGGQGDRLERRDISPALRDARLQVCLGDTRGLIEQVERLGEALGVQDAQRVPPRGVHHRTLAERQRGLGQSLGFQKTWPGGVAGEHRRSKLLGVVLQDQRLPVEDAAEAKQEVPDEVQRRASQGLVNETGEGPDVGPPEVLASQAPFPVRSNPRRPQSAADIDEADEVHGVARRRANEACLA
mmetsp:Transcript_56838/g.164967  ORF Transcript_56838/g.164967 Transcript_56838/m.164967 type:complete len:222 (+) Transcript_56838:1720-2385(+)